MIDEREVRTELIISEILRWGVRASLAIIVLGIVLSFVMPGGLDGNNTGAELQALLHEKTTFPRSVSWLWSGILHLDGTAVIVAGLALLILTPIFRVAASVVSYAVQKDRTYMIVTSAVLAMVILSFCLGYAG
jgi:uncharacterized membrane protein